VGARLSHLQLPGVHRPAGGLGAQTVEGIGEKTAEKLKDAGVDGVDDLKSIDPDELAADVDGVGADTVRDWQAKAD